MSTGTESKDALPILPLTRPPHALVRVPGSKSITNRALVLAALASRQTACSLSGVLHSEDTEVMAAALAKLGFSLTCHWNECRIDIARNSTERVIPADNADLYVANSGTSMRFLTALVALGEGRYCLDGVPRMRERPIEDLLEALNLMGARAVGVHGNGCPPVVIEAAGLQGGTVRIRGDISSQFLSGVLLAAPWARTPVLVLIEGTLVSVPYVTMTLSMMKQWGLDVFCVSDNRGVPRQIDVGPARSAGIKSYAVEPDASAASYFLAAAAITGGEVGIAGLDLDGSLQGDVAFARCLVNMGCTLVDSNPVTIRGGPLRGIEVDMNAISDCAMTLAAVACFAKGPTTLRNIAHIRHKETDRLHALATELGKLGAGVEEQPDSIRITPAELHGASIDTYSDHRMAMSLALVGLRVPGVVIRDPGCVGKTYPGFFADLEKLRVCV